MALPVLRQQDDTPGRWSENRRNAVIKDVALHIQADIERHPCVGVEALD